MANSELDEEFVRRLSHLLQEADLSEIEFESGDQRVRVARTVQVAAAPAQPAAPAAPGQAESGGAPPQPAESSEPVPEGAVTAPMVGTVYVAPEPGADPFVREGDQVQEGQTLLIVEAMKVMNPLPAPRSGTVRRVIVQDGQPVEFGEPLLVIE
ncbi:biotin carboxyl carrier protein [Limimonas halophila]|uniref:Biotin carboxyl carrier protein of acetyl-CoA carboxylase n=1 Tax=Limimonas halophila TaxID=1082479 RepID=A0A1G7QWH6_9PROT|nr:acetyl-CoA carboxylase biotin carboxyl carrier protein [Limimonas halophila]SDG02857.1 biotin carboxyl carrier protein [Limimonas halophila]